MQLHTKINKWLSQDSDLRLVNSGVLVPNHCIIFLSNKCVDMLTFTDIIKQMFILFVLKPYFLISWL